MSRYYDAQFCVSGTTEKTAEAIHKQISLSDVWPCGDFSFYEGEGRFGGEGYLYGGQDEEEFVAEVMDELSPEFDGEKLAITMTYLEDLPTETYGGIIGKEEE